MPLSLDFPEITDAFRMFLVLPVRGMAHSFEAIARNLQPRLTAVSAMERATRIFPVVAFQDDAVCFRLDPLQAGGLDPSRDQNQVLAGLQRSGGRFVHGLENAKTLVSQELILPNLIGALAATLDAVDDSIARFGQPGGDLLFAHSGAFTDDPARRRAGDLWGELALVWRTFASSAGYMTALGTALQPPKGGPSAPSAAPNGGAAAPNDGLDKAGRLLVAGLLVLPGLPAFIESLLESIVVAVKSQIIEAFAAIEANINSLRFTILEFLFTDLHAILQKALSFALAADLVLIANIDYFGRFALGYGLRLSTELQALFGKLAGTLNDYIDTFNTVVLVVGAVLEFNITPLIAGPLGLLAGALPDVTLDDLITFETDLAGAVARETVPLMLWVLGKVGRATLPDAVGFRLDALSPLSAALLRRPPGLPPEAHAPDLSRLSLPNLNAILAPRIGELRQAIAGLGQAAANQVGQAMASASAAMSVFGEGFADEAEQAARIGPDTMFSALARNAERQSTALFGPDIEALRAQVANDTTSPMAGQFERWMAHSGFDLLTAVLPAYLQEMQALWDEKRARGEEATIDIDMTSPKILARRAVLARVHVRRIVIDATGEPVGRGLAAETAERVRGAVQRAYVDGQAQLKQAAA